VLLGGSKKKKEQRFTRNVGLGFKTPREVRFLLKGRTAGSTAEQLLGVARW